MKTNKELVDYLNNLNILQTSSWEENIPEEIWNEYFKGKGVTGGLNINKHRWYETSIDVYKINNGFIGIYSVTQCYSEQSSIEDMYHYLQFYEMEEEKIISYKIK